MRRFAMIALAALWGCSDTNYGGRVVVQSDMNTSVTCATATADGELCVNGDIETNGALDVAGASTLTGAVAFGAGVTLVDDADITLGTGSDVIVSFDAAAQAPDSLFIGVGTESRQCVIGETADIGTDLTIAQQTNPTLNIHSADATDALDYITLAHDQTDGIIDVGQGQIRFADDIALTDDLCIDLGASDDAIVCYNATAQEPDSLVIGVPTTSRQVSIMEAADIGVDLTIAQQTNPTLMVHSADSGTATDYVAISHDQTDGSIITGGGNLKIAPAGATTAITGAITATTSITSTTSQYPITVGSCAATCTLGEWCLDTDATVELCYCVGGDVFRCWDQTTADGPKD